jgi:rhodanese-related sulfurtransferase
MGINLELCIKRRFLVFSVLLAVLAFTGCEQQPPEGMISYDELKLMLEDTTVMENTTIVDIRPREVWVEGYIEDAINIPYDTFIDYDLSLIDGGAALASIMTDKSRTLIFYGSEDEDVVSFAKQAATLGYTDIRYYADGIEDWIQQGNHLIIDYAGFKAWYDASCPFDDNGNHLIDVNAKETYSDVGHIPGAINIVSNYFVTDYGEEASDITLDDVVPNKNNKVVMYCYFDT